MADLAGTPRAWWPFGDSIPPSKRDSERRSFDPILLAAVLTLMGIGLVMVYSASVVAADRTLNNGEHFLMRQATHCLLGLMVLAGGMALPVRRYRALAPWMLALSIVMLAALLIPGVGITVNRSTRWLAAGPLRLQPSEFAKVSLVVFLAWTLDKRGDRVRTLKRGFLPPMVLLGVLVLLCLRQPDFGTSVMLSGLMLAMLYAGGARFIYVAGVFLASLPIGYLAIQASTTRQNRIAAWFDPFAYADGIGYHLVQSIRALGSGGLFGLGLGQSRQKLFFLPEAHTDFVLAVIGEELGLLGVLVVCGLFFVLLWRGMQASFGAPDRFSGLLAFGMTVLLSTQGAWNMAVVTGVLPTKGLTLPFVSYGGSSLLVCCWMAGILLRISTGLADPEPSARGPSRGGRRSGARVVPNPLRFLAGRRKEPYA